jgi:DNA-binding Lrp family transcriptional regulator
MDVAESNPTAGLVFCNTDYIDESNKVIGNHLSGFVLPERILRRIEAANLLLRVGCYIDSEACFIRRSTVERVGQLDEELVYACDYDYFIRAGLEVDFAYSPETLAAWRIHPQQATKTYRKIGNEIRRVFWRHCCAKDVATLTRIIVLAKIAKSVVGDAARRLKR